jgi:hypothetical protein
MSEAANSGTTQLRIGSSGANRQCLRPGSIRDQPATMHETRVHNRQGVGERVASGPAVIGFDNYEAAFGSVFGVESIERQCLTQLRIISPVPCLDVFVVLVRPSLSGC